MTKPLAVGGTASLVIAWGVGASVHARTIKIGGDVESTLRAAAVETASALKSGHPYAPDTDLEDDSHLVANRADLLDTELIGELERGPSLDLATEDEVRTKRISCYALVIESATERAVYVRKRSPITLATKSIVARLIDGTLDSIDEPLFAFDKKFDVIVADEDIYILDKRNFDLMFRDSEAVLAKAPEWVDSLDSTLPLTKTSGEFLVAALRQNSTYRTKFHAMIARPYLATLTPSALKKKMKAHDLDPAVYMPGDELDFNPNTVKDLLRLLNEDLFVGDFSQEQYAAAAKRRR